MKRRSIHVSSRFRSYSCLRHVCSCYIWSILEKKSNVYSLGQVTRTISVIVIWSSWQASYISLHTDNFRNWARCRLGKSISKIKAENIFSQNRLTYQWHRVIKRMSVQNFRYLCYQFRVPRIVFHVTWELTSKIDWKNIPSL